MIATPERKDTSVVPVLAVPTVAEAISLVNGWLHAEIGMAVNVSQANFDAVTYTWHLPIQLAFPDTGPVGVIGDVFLHAATGEFIGHPAAEELRHRATALAAAHGITNKDDGFMISRKAP